MNLGTLMGVAAALGADSPVFNERGYSPRKPKQSAENIEACLKAAEEKRARKAAKIAKLRAAQK